MSTTQIVILVVVLIAVVSGALIFAGLVLTSFARDEAAEVAGTLRCSNHLAQIGQLIMAREAGGKLRAPDGPAYLLQVASDIGDEDLEVFVCPGAPGASELTADFVEAIRTLRPGYAGRFCSYRGPDQARLAAWKKANPGKTAIVACCAQGDDGLLPHHGDGICVLYESGKVEVLAGPVRVGPDSPDPRFRHLIR